MEIIDPNCLQPSIAENVGELLNTCVCRELPYSNEKPMSEKNAKSNMEKKEHIPAIMIFLLKKIRSLYLLNMPPLWSNSTSSSFSNMFRLAIRRTELYQYSGNLTEDIFP